MQSLARLSLASELRKRLEALRPLLAELHLLDPIQGASVEELERTLAEARAAEAELSRTESARKVLGEWVEALRVPPPSPAELQRFESERTELHAERDRWFRGIEALGTAIETRGARSYTGADAALDEGTRLVPALESELESLAGLVVKADADLESAETRLAGAGEPLSRARRPPRRDCCARKARRGGALAPRARLHGRVRR